MGEGDAGGRGEAGGLERKMAGRSLTPGNPLPPARGPIGINGLTIGIAPLIFVKEAQGVLCGNPAWLYRPGGRE